MAKCKHWDYCMLDADLRKSAKCRGKDPSCNIIPKKPKTKSVRAWIFYPKNLGPHSTTGKVTDITTQDMKGIGAWEPCTITYRVKGVK